MPADKDLVGSAVETGKTHLRDRFSDLESPEFEKAIDDRISGWAEEVMSYLDRQSPFVQEYRCLENCKADSVNLTGTRDSLMQDIANCGGLGERSKEFWMRRASTAEEKDLALIRKELLEFWEDSLERRLDEWSMKVIDKERAGMIDSMETWLRFVQDARKLMTSLGLSTGVLWDMSFSAGTSEDRGELFRWAEIFRTDAELRNLCEMLGRSILLSRSQNMERTAPVSFDAKQADASLKEELTGIELGHRIEDMLPTDRSLLNDPDLEVLFDLKYAEDRLMCFEKQGYVSIEGEREEEVEENEEEKTSGPIIMCIDTSGSMNGTPEDIAKGVAFYLAMRAMSESRRCYIINFSTEIRTIDIGPENGMNDLQEFLAFSFHGGTDIDPAFREAVKRLSDEEYERADILTISDFVMPPDALKPLQGDIDDAKDRGCRFHCLAIGNFAFTPNISDIFDECWYFDSATRRVKSRNLVL